MMATSCLLSIATCDVKKKETVHEQDEQQPKRLRIIILFVANVPLFEDGSSFGFYDFVF